jgi:carbonic anhydrase/acetyltransferase-like protein (isoleucine patch superfamily)
MAIYNLPPYETRIDDSAYVAPGAIVIGCVTLGRRSSKSCVRCGPICRHTR